MTQKPVTIELLEDKPPPCSDFRLHEALKIYIRAGNYYTTQAVTPLNKQTNKQEAEKQVSKPLSVWYAQP